MKWVALFFFAVLLMALYVMSRRHFRRDIRRSLADEQELRDTLARQKSHLD